MIWHYDYDSHEGQSGQFISEITALIYKCNHFSNNRNYDVKTECNCGHVLFFQKIKLFRLLFSIFLEKIHLHNKIAYI